MKYRFTMELNVNDIDALATRALNHAVHVDGLSNDEAKVIIYTDGVLDVGACLVTVLDPGSLPGCEIDYSTAERY